MEIYISGIVFCPMNKAEQDADSCIGCGHFGKHGINQSAKGGRQFIECSFPASRVDAYKSTKSGIICTVVSDEPLPPTKKSGECWKPVRL